MPDSSLTAAETASSEAEIAGRRPSLRMTGIQKTFAGVAALKSVTFETVAGEIHALVGENGAGKSTLMGVAAGDLVPDVGKVEIGGRELDAFAPGISAGLGLALVHQHPTLLPDLTVAENLALAMPASRRPSMRRAAEWARTRLALWDAAIDPHARAGDLPLAEQHNVDLVKALALDPRVLVLDEPTEHMDGAQVRRLFQTIRELQTEGRTIIYISHRIHEVKEIADRVTVLRDGESSGTFATDALDVSQIVNLVVGRTLETAFPPKLAGHAQMSPRALSVRGLSGAGFADVTFDAHAGEIIGLAGIEGNGQRAFLRALAGLGRAVSGDAEVNGRAATLADPHAAHAAGFVYVPRERHQEALMLTLSVGRNIGLGSLARHAVAGLVRVREELRAIGSQMEALSIKAPGLATPIQNLSGGNQQKAVIARCLLAAPAVLLADEPSQGVDAGARFEIYKILRAASARGVGVIVASADALELAGLCDRVLIFSRGQVVTELDGESVTERNITQAALTATTLRTRQSGAAKPNLRGFLGGGYAPSLVLILVMLALGGYAAVMSPAYLTGRNFGNVLTMLTALGFIALGQLVVVLAGSIDLSVGPLTGFSVVVASFLVNDGAGPGRIALGFALSAACALTVGAVNVILIRHARITPVIATLSTYMGLQGLSLLLRPIPDGLINADVTAAIGLQIGFLPLAFLLLLLAVLGLELALHKTRWGVALRAVGSGETNARKAGVRVGWAYLGAHLACVALTFLGSVMLMAQIGVGDPTAGINYTLSSITAVVLGGTSLFGGRGSFVGALLGAALIQQIINITTFIGLTPAWQYWLLGLMTLGAAAFYSRARGAAQATSPP